MDYIKRKYGYSYDHQHRLTAAYYQLPGTVIPRSDSYSTSYSYDENGNILSLKRNGKEDDPNLLMEIDDLDYTYDQGNRLLKVKDATNDPAGFNMNGADTNAQYTYDDYGNLKTDPYKKITNITYNHLHLPVKVTFQGGETIEYTYLADGTKIKKTAKDTQNTTTTTEYREGFQYIDDVLEFFPTSEGYVKYNSNNLIDIYSYVFTYTDHLGNIRLKYTENPQTGELTILEEDHYYPYGLTHQGYQSNHQTIGFDGQVFTLIPVTPQAADSYKYKFNGMEWQDEFDVNLYDFGARNYDPALGRWMNIDPMAEAMRRHSPYNFAFNNPVYFIDPDGMSPLVSMASMQTSAVEFYDFSDTEIYNSDGKKIGQDSNGNDGNVSIVSNKHEARHIEKDFKKGKIATQSDVEKGVQTTKTELKESLHVLNRVVENGGLSEESSVVNENGEITRGERGPEFIPGEGNVAESIAADVPGNNNTSIHGHLTSNKVSSSALVLGPNDRNNFKKFKRNIITGRLGETSMVRERDALGNIREYTHQPKLGIVIYDRSSVLQTTLTIKAVQNILK